MLLRPLVTAMAWLFVAGAFCPTVALAAGHGRSKAAAAHHKTVEKRERPHRDTSPDAVATPIPSNNASAAAPSTPSTSGAPPPSRGPTRIDFDDRLVTGQTNKTGSVYLYDRKELKATSMLKMRESFREEIVGSVYDR